MTQPQITNEIVNSKLKMVLQVERGTFIVPSFDEIWPQPGKERLGKGSKRMGIDYILEVILRTISIIISNSITLLGNATSRTWSPSSTWQLHHMWSPWHWSQPVQQSNRVLRRRNHRRHERREGHHWPSWVGRQASQEQHRGLFGTSFKSLTECFSETQRAPDESDRGSEAQISQLRSEKKRRNDGDQRSVDSYEGAEGVIEVIWHQYISSLLNACWMITMVTFLQMIIEWRLVNLK